MAKKKSESVEPEAVEARQKPPHKSVSMLCVEGLDQLGNQASTADVKAYILSKYPGIALNDNTLSTTLSQTRSKRTGASAAKKRASGGPGEPSLTDLFVVKQIADKEDGVERLAEQVDHLMQLADQVGGIENLHRCMQALKKLK